MEYLYTVLFLIVLFMVFWETRDKVLSIFFFIGLAMAFQVIGILLFQSIFPAAVNVSAIFIFVVSIAGIWLGIKFWKYFFKKNEPQLFHSPASINQSWLTPYKYTWLVIFSIFLILILMYSFVDYYIPLFAASSQVAKIQFAMGRGIYMRIFKTFIPITAMFFIAFIIKENPSLPKKIFSVVIIIMLMILAFLTAYKAWPAFTLILMFLIYYYSRKGARVFYFFGTVLLSIISSMLITYFIYHQDIITTSILLMGRLTQDQVLPVIKCVEIAQRDGFRMGSTFLSDFQYMMGTFRIMDRPPTVFAVEVYTRLYGSNPSNFTAPTGFIGEVYVNFGLIGLFVFSTLFGASVYAIHDKTKQAINIYSKVILIYLLFMFLYMTWGGTVIGTFEDLGISGIIFFLFWFIYNKMIAVIENATHSNKLAESDGQQ
jgi:oligosaccharide repeat unit polymerase